MSGWTVGQVADAAGVTVRTLHHWEQVGLLVPGGRTSAGHRRYDAADVARLQRVLAYRELGFGLHDARALLDGEREVTGELRRQCVQLRDEAARLLRMAAAIEKNMEARAMGIELEPHELLEVFGEANPTRHAAEAEQRWGATAAFEQSRQRTGTYGKQDWLRCKAELEDLESRLAAAVAAGEPADGDGATGLAEEHRRGIDTWFYDCSVEMHRSLGQMYVDDPRFTKHYDDRAPGLAWWLHEAIEANAARRSG